LNDNNDIEKFKQENKMNFANAYYYEREEMNTKGVSFASARLSQWANI